MSQIPILRERRSGEIARRRLKILLASDKTNCSPEMIEMIKDDIIHAISKYMEIDSAYMEVGITNCTSSGQGGAVSALYASIPIRDLSVRGPFHDVF